MFLRTQRRAQSLPASVDKHVVVKGFKDIDGESSACESAAESYESITRTSAGCGESLPVSPSPASSTSLAAYKPQTVPEMAPLPPPPSRLHSLEWVHEAKGSLQVCWKVDARKLRGNDKQAVSPPFELPLGPSGRSMKLRIVIYPKTPDSRNPVNFRSSKGKGYVQVKCESDELGESAPVSLTLSVGSGRLAQPARDLGHHDFARNGICGLSRDKDTWDFSSAVEAQTMIFRIFLGITSPLDKF